MKRSFVPDPSATLLVIDVDILQLRDGLHPSDLMPEQPEPPADENWSLEELL